MKTGLNSDRSSTKTLFLVSAILLIGIIAVILFLPGPSDAPREIVVTAPFTEPFSVDQPVNPRDTTASSTLTHFDTPGQPRSISVPTPNIWDPRILVTYWWEDVPSVIRENSTPTGNFSNIHRKDYVGAAACSECHEQNYQSWKTHAHRLMNARASAETVGGDFSGTATIQYRGGTGQFFKQGDQYYMQLTHGNTNWVYQVTRTIGSRFFQYYAGRLIKGQISDEAPRATKNHVLPFGYWLDRKQWVPTVHVFRNEDADHEHYDPYAALPYMEYDHYCGDCHTTRPAGDWMLRHVGKDRLKEYTPRSIAFHYSDYLAASHPGMLQDNKSLATYSQRELLATVESTSWLSTEEHAVALGITCESCHNGGRQHVENSTESKSDLLPSFFFASPHFYSHGTNATEVLGRNPGNLNFACAKCHSGGRPEYANGTHTWNSTEFADGARGRCYNPLKAKAKSMNHLTCVHCHDPHTGIGKKWTKTSQEDDQSCISCHKQFSSKEQITAHTHHSSDSTGSQCLNCHMPKINEGLQAMVRTHRIFSPTDRVMLEANQVNACNLCHLEKPIDWTLTHLKGWFGDGFQFDEAKIARNYRERQGSVGLGWIHGPHAPTRLAAAEALLKAKVTSALPDLIGLLDTEDYLINRQFTQKGIEEMLGIRLDQHGYQFYMMGAERTKAVASLKEFVLKKAASLKQN